MNSLLRREKKNAIGRRSSMVAPSGVSIPASFSYTPLLEAASCNIPTSGMVAGLNSPLLCYEGRSVNHHAGDCLHFYKHSLQQPNYGDRATRLQSFKYWDGLISPVELVDAGFYMIASRDVVRCCSCNVVIANWRRGDSAIDVHCLYRPNCGFVKNYMEKLNEVDGNVASSDDGRVVNQRLYSESTLIDSVGPKTAQPLPDNISRVTNHLITGINYPPSQRSVSTHGHVVKDSGRKLSEEILDSPPEEIVFSERRLCEGNGINAREDEARILPMIMCKVCHIKQVDHVFLPCGDAKTCEGCARQIFRSGRPCYFCNRLVATYQPIYL